MQKNKPNFKSITLLITLLTCSNLFAQNFSIGNGNYIVTSGSPFITVTGGTFDNNGTILNTEGTISFSGPIVYSGSGSTTTKNLEIAHSGTSTLNNRIHVTGTLSINNGTLNANNNLTLVSNASGSAVVAPIAIGSDVTGKVTVERYIAQGKRAFRFLTPSVTTDDFILNNWQQATHITGSTSGQNGFDTTASGGPSLFIYNNNQSTGSGWEPIDNTDATNLTALKGYRILIRGDRTPTLITQASQPTMNTAITLSATGTLATGTIVFNSNSTIPINNTTNTITEGYSFIGNPYVNTVNWNNLTKTGLTDAYYVWDANMGTTSQRGRYVAYSTSTGVANSGLGTSSMNEYIQPGQAFFVKNTALGTPGTLTFNETDKTGTNINNFYRSSSNILSRLELQVYETSELILGNYPIDAAVCVFDNQFTNAIENGDVTKMSTGVENICFYNANKDLAIDARPLVINTDELQVKLQQFKANKNYTFKTLFTDFDLSTTPFLLDTYLNQYIPLLNNNATSVSFSTSDNSASYDMNRFKIVFQNTLLSNSGINSEDISIYPNPITNNQFNIALPNYLSGKITIKLINAIGQIVHITEEEASPNLTIIPNQTLANGMYLVQISNNGKTITKKIIIQ